MTSLKAITRVSLYMRLLMPVAAVLALLFFILRRGAAPSSVLSVFNWDVIAAVNPVIWIMAVTGLTGFLLGSWIWILRPKSLPAFLFGLSGLATLAFTFSPLLYFAKTPVSQEFAAVLARTNMYGASLFGIAICALLLVYPNRLPFYKVLPALMIIVFGGWTLWASRDLQNVNYFVQLITLIEMLGIVALSIWQILVSKGQADKRAVAIWLSACVIVGSGPFIALVAAPASFGREVIMAPHFAFAFFNIVYIGFAIGLLRLRLFDLGSWAFQILFHAGLAVLFIVIDVALVSSLTVQSGTALTLTALALAVLYLPIRGWLWSRLNGKRMNESEMFQSVIETGLKPSGEARAESWVNLLRRTFNPADIALGPAGEHAVSLSKNGESLILPAAMDAPALILRYKQEGRSLFSTRDQTLAAQLLTLIKQVDGSRQAYDRGVNEERSRIGRDIHDNIGAQLLQALHSDKAGRKDEMIRESLSDLRDVINNSSVAALSLPDMLADLRAETAERAESYDVELIWEADNLDNVSLNGDQLHALRSVLREAVSNVFKHSGATKLKVSFKTQTQDLFFCVEDNGKGMSGGKAANGRGGHGLKNMRERIEDHGGVFAMETSEAGTKIMAEFSSKVGT